MKSLASLSFHIVPLLLVLALAGMTMLSSHRADRAPQATYAAGSFAPEAPHTPYGSSAAMRALLF